ncbi:hypothetical protein [Candidatus Methanoprimaticola sp. MG2]
MLSAPTVSPSPLRASECVDSTSSILNRHPVRFISLLHLFR